MKVLVDKEKLFEILKDFHKLTGIRVSFIENFDKPIMGVPGDNCELCALKQKDKDFYLRCKKCDKDAASYAKNFDEFYIYECHYHLTEAIQPLKHYGNFIGYFVLGQMLIDKNNFIQKNNPSEKELQLLDKLASPTLEVLRSAAKILSCLAKYSLMNKDIYYTHKENFELIESYLKENYAKKITIDDICKKFHYSRSSLFNLFNEEYKSGINEYINNLRLEKSKELLSEYKIIDVANMVGIPDSNYFSRLFKKTFGISPLEYKSRFFIK